MSTSRALRSPDGLHAYELSRADALRLAEALGDRAETVISVHLLRRGLCRAYAAGDPGHSAAAIVQGVELPAEPTAYGADAQLLWDVLQTVPGWECVNVPAGCAVALGERMAATLGLSVRHYQDIYYRLDGPVAVFRHSAVRRLGPADEALLAAAPPTVRGGGFGDTATLLRDGIVAAAVIAGQVVAIAHTSARTAAYADIGVGTLPEWRGQGLATAAAALVAGAVQAEGQTPVWSCGEANLASRRVAEKLGYVEFLRRIYLIPETSRT